jgi:hypothetical protein
MPYLIKHNIKARIISTETIPKLGASAMHEIFIQNKETPQIGAGGCPLNFDAFTLNDVEKCF